MTRGALLLLATAMATPAAAQQHEHHQHQEQPAPAVDPHAGHHQEEQPDQHAGHEMRAASDPHAGHGATAPAPPVLPPPAEALSGPQHAADAIFGAPAMAESRRALREEHGGMTASKLLVDKLEARIKDGRNGWHLDAQGWVGGDIDKFWVKAELEGDIGRKLEHAEVQALWSRAIDPWFDLQAGVRFDPQPGPNRTHLVLGVQGLAPYWFEVEGALFLSHKGELTARAEAEYDFRITERLILQPRVEAELSAQNVPELGLGSGLTTAELGARLRYQVSPTFAPYVGVSYERAFGDTRRFRRAEGERAGGINLLAGVRFLF